MSIAVNALRAVEEEFKRLAIILPKDYIDDVISSLNKEPPQDEMLSRILFEMSQNGYIRPVIVDGEEKVYPTEKFIEVLAFTEASNVLNNSVLGIKYKNDSGKFHSFLTDFRMLCSDYCKDRRMEESDIGNSKFLEVYKKSLKKYHEKLGR